jgi:hypothetical protein
VDWKQTHGIREHVVRVVLGLSLSLPLQLMGPSHRRRPWLIGASPVASLQRNSRHRA